MDYSSNSFKSRETDKKEEMKKPNKVISGKATLKERSGAQKVADNIIVGSAKSTGDYILTEIIFPAIKNMVWSAISNGIHMMLFGSNSSKSSKVRGSNIIYDGGSYRDDYTSYSRDKSRPIARRAIFENPILDSLEDANAVLDAMEDAISHYQYASWATLYDIIGIDTDNWQANKFGWTDIRGADIATIHRTDGTIGYELRMPKASPIDD